jgi:hypothetical protein
LLGTLSTSRATPDLFILDLGQAEGRLSDDLADTEVSNPVPGANRIAHAALIADVEGVSAVILYDIENLLGGGYNFHWVSSPLLSP